jgi:ribonuclease HII
MGGLKQFVIGADECGRGSWAGPVCICVIKAPINWSIPGLRDSKKLKAHQREKICETLNQLIVSKEIQFALAERSNTCIDEIGIDPAQKECYVECFKQLYDEQSSIVVDGNMSFAGLGIDDYDLKSVVRADDTVPQVSAASIWCKVFRDAKMKVLGKQYPEYDFGSNAGYWSPIHKASLDKYGLTPLHRKSYEPMKSMIQRNQE